MAEIELTADNFEQEVLKADKPVMVDFWAEWCVPCRMLSPLVEELAEEMDGKVLVGKANVDEMPSIAEKYGIQSIPTVMVFHKGEIVKSNIGVVPKDTLEGMFDGLL